MLAQEKCGESVKALQHSSACELCYFAPSVIQHHLVLAVYAEVEKLCVRYSRTKGPGTIARPERHPFFQKLGPMVKSSLEKSTRENGFMSVPVYQPSINTFTIYFSVAFIRKYQSKYRIFPVVRFMD